MTKKNSVLLAGYSECKKHDRRLKNVIIKFMLKYDTSLFLYILNRIFVCFSVYRNTVLFHAVTFNAIVVREAKDPTK